MHQSKSVSPAHSWATRSHPQSLGKVPGNLPKRLQVLLQVPKSLQALLPRPLHFTTSQVSRSFTLAAVPFNNLIWHQESPDNFLLSSQTPPPTWPQRMASGTKRHPPEKAPLGSPGELAGMKDISEASQGQVGTTEGADSPGYVSLVLQATSLHCQQKSKGENSTWFYRLLRTKLPWGEFSVVDGVLRP